MIDICNDNGKQLISDQDFDQALRITEYLLSFVTIPKIRNKRVCKILTEKWKE